jgi:hypothetical protein
LIVVSGVLVAVALVFLIIGLFQHSGIGFILVSIVTSLVSGVFLLLGALQRRGAPAAVADGGTSGTEALERVTAVSVRPREEAAPAAEAAAAEGPMVSVVRGRPRYHVESCRFLTGRPDVEQISVDEARGEGYTACGVCKPDAAIAAAAEAPAVTAEETAEPETMSDDTALLDTASGESVQDTGDEAPTPRKTAARKAPAKTAAATATKPAKKAAAATATKATAAKSTSASTASKSTAAAAKPAAGSVVVIPDRGKFHTETCRFVKDVPGTVTLTKTTAKRQGYTACGVCKP